MRLLSNQILWSISILTLVLGFSFTANAQLSGAYTIDAATATGGTNYQTFTAAAAALNSSGVSGAVTFDVVQGTYNERFILNAITGTSVTNTITFRPAVANTAAVILTNAATGSANNYAIRFNGADYVTVEGLDIRNTGTTYCRVIDFLGANTNVTLRNNNLTSPITNSTSTLRCVIYNGTGTGNMNNNFTLDGNVLTGGSYSLYLRGGTTTTLESNNQILNNEFRDYYYMGIYCYYQTGCVIDGNVVIANPGVYSTNYGIYNYYSDFATVTNNKINVQATSTNYGIAIGYNDGSTGNPGLVANNMISCGNNTGTTYGIYCYYNSYQNLYHNSINIEGSTSTSKRGIYFASSTSSTTYTGINVNNNIVANMAGGYAFERTTSTITANYIAGMDNNDWYSTGATVIRNGTTNHPTLAAWQTASSFDANSISVDPQFFAPDDLHLNNGALNNLGGLGTGIVADIDGDIRCPGAGCPGAATAPDMGADEFDPVANDASIVGIASPTLPVCAGTFTITAEVGNQGLVNLTSVMVNWSVNGVPQTPVTATGLNIAPGTTGTVVLGSYTFVSGTTYNIEITSSMPNGVADLLPINDMYATSTSPAMSGTFSINSAVATGGTNFQTFADAVTALNGGICGPVVINVVQGTYNEQMELPNIPGSSAANTVTFQADVTNTAPATLTYTATGSANNYVIWFNGTQYVTVSGLEIDASGTTYSRAIVFSQSNEFINVMDNTITAPTSTSTSTFRAVIYHNTGTGNIANNIVLDGNSIMGGSYGIYLYGGNTSTLEQDNRISNNSFSDYYFYGIFAYYQNGLEIENNDIEANLGAYSTQYGVRYYYCDNGTIVANRIVTGGTSTNYGLYIYYADATSAAPSDFSNNMVSCLGGTGTSYGIYMYNSTYGNLYHNSVNVTGGNTTSASGIYVNSTSTIYGNHNLLNNIAKNSGGGYALNLSSSATGAAIVNMDNNNWYATGTAVVNYSGSAQTSFAAYQTVAAPKEANSISADPSYAADDDLHVCNGLLNGTGALGTGITSDIDGDVRCPGAGCPGGLSNPDIGADEFVEPAGDVKPQALLYPEDNKCGQVSQNIVVSLVNTRCVSIDSVAVTVNVTGPLPTTVGGTLEPIMLPGDDTATFFVGAIPTTTAGLYTFQIITQLPGDIDPSNDTLVVAINVTAAMIVTSNTNDATCLNNNGSVTVAQTGGVAPYTYAWDNTQNTASISGLVAGDYVVSVSDAAGCEASITATVATTSGNVSGTTTTVDANCGNPDGSATAVGAGGAMPYSYIWSNGAFGATANNLVAGTYDVTITDANGCVNTSSATIGINSGGSLAVSTSSTNAGCATATGSASAAVSGGSGVYTYTWSNGMMGTTVNGLAAGTYTVTVSDAGGCSTIATVTVSNTTDLAGTATSNAVACNGQTNGSIDFSPSGGTAPYTFVWSNGGNTEDINNLAGGAYDVTVTDAGGCIAVVSGINVVDPAVLATTATVSPANGIGFNGSIDVTVTGGTAPFTYAWSDGWIEEDYMNVQSGTYSVTVTDANGCSTVETYTVSNTTSVSLTEEGNWTVNLYPNPAETQATIDVQLSSTADVQIRLINVTGQLLQTANYTGTQNIQHVVNVGELPAGVYMVQILADQQTTTRRLVVKK